MRKRYFIFSFLIILSFIGGCLGNSKYINIADDTPEVRGFIDLYPNYNVSVYGDYMEPVVHVVYVAEEDGQKIKLYVAVERDTEETKGEIVEVWDGEDLTYSTHKPFEFFKRKYIAIANQTAEAQAFLRRYPNATILVDDSGGLAVDFRVNEYEQTSESEVPPYLRLRLYVNPETNRIDGRFLECTSGNRIFIDDAEKIEFYLLHRECFHTERKSTFTKGNKSFEKIAEEGYLYIDGYKYKIISNVGGPVAAEVNRSLNLSTAVKVGDTVIFYTGISSKIREEPTFETLNVGWADINIGTVKKIENEILTVRYIRAGVAFEKKDNNTFKAVPKPAQSLVQITRGNVLDIRTD
ncbi:hypothetical protein BMS3Abin16_01287 [archaeon BMS3Abin16]|nr:hypothetical protein BMS3Abin16_01287 [archaeon BMS3Abin16]GBE56384.1 hypothetical protein BMS3Bbin16_00588 [archaeon BMS3Bbin16]